MIPVTGNPSGFQRIQFESGGNIDATPASAFCQTYATFEAVNEVYAIASSTGDRGLVVGAGVNGLPAGVLYAVPFFGGDSSTPFLGPQLHYAGGFPEPSTAIVIPDTGDEALTSVASPQNALLVASGIATSVPKASELLMLPSDAAGLVVTANGKALVVRSGFSGGQPTAGLTVFSVAGIAPVKGALGGMVAHTYTKTATFLQTSSGVISPGQAGGRAAMAADPADPSRVVLAGTPDGGFSMAVQVVSGLPNAPVPGKSMTIEPNVSGIPFAVAVSRDGKYAYVATKNGIDTVSGVGGNALNVTGTTYLPASAPRLNSARSLATSLDGKYLIAAMNSGASCTTLSAVPLCGELVVAPIGANGALGTPVLIDNDAGEVDNDTMLAF